MNAPPTCPSCNAKLPSAAEAASPGCGASLPETASGLRGEGSRLEATAATIAPEAQGKAVEYAGVCVGKSPGKTP
jgi:hypothetical protein